MEQKDISKIRAHDAIVGLLSLAFAYLTSNINFLWIVIAVGALQLLAQLLSFALFILFLTR